MSKLKRNCVGVKERKDQLKKEGEREKKNGKGNTEKKVKSFIYR